MKMDKSHIFREYDIRGIFEKDLNQDIVEKIGFALGKLLKDKNETSICIGFDARSHSKILFDWLSTGLALQDIKIYDLGLIPTPVAYFATFDSDLKVQNSIMITGSHNPKEYNGFKITLFGKPFYGQEIQKLKNSISLLAPLQTSRAQIQATQTLQNYINFLTQHFQALKNFPLKIALDCGNGVAGIGIIPILKNLDIDFVTLYAEPDGTFPNHHPDPSEEENLHDLKELMKAQNIPIGLAFDGDADRIALLTSNHSYKGDELAILYAREIASQIAPNKPIIIGEVKCSQVMYDECNKLGTSVMYKTGHSNLKVKLKELNASLAAEMSGHIFFNDRYFGYDDAIYAGLRALELFLNKSVEELESSIFSLPKLYSTAEEKIPTKEDQKFQIIQKLTNDLKNPPSNFPKILDLITIDGIRIVFEEGWGLVRASNTTPVLVTRFEAKSEAKLQEYKEKTLALIHLD